MQACSRLALQALAVTPAMPAVCQVETCTRLALQALADDMCCIIGLQSTGEANTTSAREMTEVSTAPHFSLCSALRCCVPLSTTPLCTALHA